MLQLEDTSQAGTSAAVLHVPSLDDPQHHNFSPFLANRETMQPCNTSNQDDCCVTVKPDCIWYRLWFTSCWALTKQHLLSEIALTQSRSRAAKACPKPDMHMRLMHTSDFTICQLFACINAQHASRTSMPKWWQYLTCCVPLIAWLVLCIHVRSRPDLSSDFAWVWVYSAQVACLRLYRQQSLLCIGQMMTKTCNISCFSRNAWFWISKNPMTNQIFGHVPAFHWTM